MSNKNVEQKAEREAFEVWRKQVVFDRELAPWIHAKQGYGGGWQARGEWDMARAGKQEAVDEAALVGELYSAIFYSPDAPSYKTNCRGFRDHGKGAIASFVSKRLCPAGKETDASQVSEELILC